jgi:hypothetical protein
MNHISTTSLNHSKLLSKHNRPINPLLPGIKSRNQQQPKLNNNTNTCLKFPNHQKFQNKHLIKEFLSYDMPQEMYRDLLKSHNKIEPELKAMEVKPKHFRKKYYLWHKVPVNLT